MMIVHNIAYHPPQTPNYLRPISNNYPTIHISNLTDEQIEELGMEFVRELKTKRDAFRADMADSAVKFMTFGASTSEASHD